MAVNSILAGIMVKDHPAALDWYTRAFGREPDNRPMDGCVEWRFPDGGWIQLFHEPERAGWASVVLTVTDLDEQLTELEQAGIEAGAPQTVPDFARISMVTDPEGNRLTFVQDISPSKQA